MVLEAAARGVFSPRVDYDEWTPLGRGDPLKNDPTYDYVPPVLERVHYWLEPSSRTPDPPEVPVLRPRPTSPPPIAPSTTVAQYQPEARRDVFDPFLKFVDGPKFSPGYRRQPPLTVLAPPPPSVTLQQAELVYHASTTTWQEGQTQLATVTTPLPTINLSALLQTLLRDEAMTATTAAPTTSTATPTTTMTSLTTDPLFSHYRQPAEPLRGPMYLIIQGHSKVKTYGAAKPQHNFHGIPLQESNDIRDADSPRRRRQLLLDGLFSLGDVQDVLGDLLDQQDQGSGVGPVGASLETS